MDAPPVGRLLCANGPSHIFRAGGHRKPRRQDKPIRTRKASDTANMNANMPIPPSLLSLEDAFQFRPVNTHIFAPFLVARLMEHPDTIDNAIDYEISLQNIRGSGAQTVPLRLTWTEAMIPPVPLAAQREYITEAAAYGLAFAILARFTSAQLVDVAERGERFDYVLDDAGILYGIEVSGTQTEERQVLRDRHAQKIRQLLDNPHRRGGYVAIVGFTRREVVLSYHLAERNR